MTLIFSKIRAAVIPACRQAGFFGIFLWMAAKESTYRHKTFRMSNILKKELLD
jgi:hypothetical protein